jgi:hypothetical protein
MHFLSSLEPLHSFTVWGFFFIYYRLNHRFDLGIDFPVQYSSLYLPALW